MRPEAVTPSVTLVARSLFAIGVCGLAAALLLFFLLGSAGGVERVWGTRAGDLDARFSNGAGVPLRRGGSYMLALEEVNNVGNAPIPIESVEPQSTSPNLRATKGRIWIMPRTLPPLCHGTSILGLPSGWPGWPPKNLPGKPPGFCPKSYVAPPSSFLSLPTSQTIYPGRRVALIYGISLHADPSPKFRITSLRITFKQGDRTIVWTLPEPVNVFKPH